MENQALVSIKEMAKILDVKPSWIYQRTMRGKAAIPHIKVGKYVRFKPEEVMKFLQDKGR